MFGRLRRWWTRSYLRSVLTVYPASPDRSDYGVHLYRLDGKGRYDVEAVLAAMFVSPRQPEAVIIGPLWEDADTPLIEEILSHEYLHITLMRLGFPVRTSAGLDYFSNKGAWRRRPIIGGF